MHGPMSNQFGIGIVAMTDLIKLVDEAMDSDPFVPGVVPMIDY